MGSIESKRSKAVRNVDKSFVHTKQLQMAGERYHAGRENGPRAIAASFAERQIAAFIDSVQTAGVGWAAPLDQDKLEVAIAGIENQKLQTRFRQHGQLVWDTITRLRPPEGKYRGILIWRNVNSQGSLDLEYQYITD